MRLVAVALLAGCAWSPDCRMPVVDTIRNVAEQGPGARRNGVLAECRTESLIVRVRVAGEG